MVWGNTTTTSCESFALRVLTRRREDATVAFAVFASSRETKNFKILLAIPQYSEYARPLPSRPAALCNRDRIQLRIVSPCGFAFSAALTPQRCSRRMQMMNARRMSRET